MKALYPTALFILLSTTTCTQPAHAPADFTLRIEDYTDTINTFQGTFTRRGIASNKAGEVFRDTTVHFDFTSQQKDSIYRMMGNTHFFTLPAVLTPQCNGIIHPSSTDNLATRCNGVEHKVRFENGCETADNRVKEFQRLLSFIYKMVYRNPQIRALPNSELFIL
ncbi:hypothetical protein K3G63_17955 [Hymenobacter sp. HSC-4F20]|uniref:hypothetical protein n=1 Tax=Hymenobacter sp. HSC-4F20 TaxID=2864135 RepID=UPI001C72FCBF|nr:hypothetical protein [Hymenobacter sp. HSC-4F20]MBX0292336.1 hypothetical protein [Hymenobacter sp. HSC-4F20]